MEQLLAQSRITNPIAPKLSPSTPAQGFGIFSSLVSTIISWMIVIGILLFILFFLTSTFKWITAQGDKQQLENARQGVLHAVIGLVVIFALFAIIRALEATFGVCILQIPIPILGQSNPPGCMGLGGIGGGVTAPQPVVPGSPFH